MDRSANVKLFSAQIASSIFPLRVSGNASQGVGDRLRATAFVLFDRPAILRPTAKRQPDHVARRQHLRDRQALVLAEQALHEALSAVLTAPAHGTVILNANGSFAYAPATGYAGPDTFARLPRLDDVSRAAVAVLEIGRAHV